MFSDKCCLIARHSAFVREDDSHIQNVEWCVGSLSGQCDLMGIRIAPPEAADDEEDLRGKLEAVLCPLHKDHSTAHMR